jgi:hypothetical protein
MFGPPAAPAGAGDGITTGPVDVGALAACNLLVNCWFHALGVKRTVVEFPNGGTPVVLDTAGAGGLSC